MQALKAAEVQSPIRGKKQFLPTRRRIDREINKLKFAYKGEVIMGLTASYGTMSSDDTDIMLILDNINADGTVATVKPFIGYFYRDNNMVGLRLGSRHIGMGLGNLEVDLGSQNDLDISLACPGRAKAAPIAMGRALAIEPWLNEPSIRRRPVARR